VYPSAGARNALRSCHSQHTQVHLPEVAAAAVLGEVNPLPGAQAELAVIDGHGQADGGDHRAHMRRGIVGAFDCVHVPILTLGCDMAQVAFQISPGGGVITFVDHQGGAGVRDKQESHPRAHLPPVNLLLNLAGEIVQALFFGLDGKRGGKPVHCESPFVVQIWGRLPGAPQP
jgi:hypothetical protein